MDRIFLRTSGIRFFWIGIYAIGIIVGFVGLFSLVSKSWDDPRIQSFTFVWIALVLMSIWHA